MQATQHNTPLASNGQPTKDNRIFDNWTRQTETAIEALFAWKAYLRAWQTHPNVTDAAFMAAVQNMAEAGLSEWLDANQAGIDALRVTLTGGAR